MMRAKNGSEDSGYIPAFLLSPLGDIIERLLVRRTTTKAGVANSVSVMNDSDRFVALADWKGAGVGNGCVQIWSVERLDDLMMKRDAEDIKKTTSTVKMEEVVRIDVNDMDGCCANVVWYD